MPQESYFSAFGPDDQIPSVVLEGILQLGKLGLGVSQSSSLSNLGNMVAAIISEPEEKTGAIIEDHCQFFDYMGISFEKTVSYFPENNGMRNIKENTISLNARPSVVTSDVIYPQRDLYHEINTFFHDDVPQIYYMHKVEEPHFYSEREIEKWRGINQRRIAEHGTAEIIHTYGKEEFFDPRAEALTRAWGEFYIPFIEAVKPFFAETQDLANHYKGISAWLGLSIVQTLTVVAANAYNGVMSPPLSSGDYVFQRSLAISPKGP